MDGDGSDDSVIRRARFSGGPARSFLSSMDADRRIFEADLAVDRAHVVMLAEQEIVEPEVAGAILGALDAIEREGFDALPEAEDVHEAIESAVIDRIGPDGGRMHTARSRNDEVATCIRYRLRTDLLAAVEATLALREAALDLAAEHGDTVMPGYTHLQPAQPVTVGHWALSYAQAAARDTDRLLDAYRRTNRCPLGAAAFAGTSLPIDRSRTASLLGFSGVVENATDAVSTRDFLVEALGALATAATTASGLAEDGVVFANRGFVALDDDYASTSSIMPQKKNPDSLELVRATAGDATGELAGALTSLKGLPRAYNRDLQRVTPHLWRSADAVTAGLEVAAGALATATWRVESLESAADEGFATATGVAEVLAAAGVPFRTAHHVVADAATDGGDYAALEAAAREHLDDELEAVVDPETIEAVLDPARNVEMRDSRGGPAPAQVAAAHERLRDRFETDRSALTEHREALEGSTARLEREVREYG